MNEFGILGILLVLINLATTYFGLKDMKFFDKYCFRVGNIIKSKDYKRLITSGFLHVSWSHFFMNMITLICFSPLIENHQGEIQFLIIYFASLIGASIFTLYLQKNYLSYNAVGASGAVSGVVFATIAMFPDLQIAPYGILFMPSWLYGFAYVLYTIYGIIKKRDYIGHEAHLGGGLIGLSFGILFEPSSLYKNYLPILLIAVPSIIFILYHTKKMNIFALTSLFKKGSISSESASIKTKKIQKPNTKDGNEHFGIGQGQAKGKSDENILPPPR